MNQAPSIFNRNRVARYRDRAARRFAEHDFLLTEVMENMAERLTESTRRFPCVLDLGCHTGKLAQLLQERGDVLTLVQSELSGEMLRQASGLRVRAEEELLPFAPHVFDLVISALSLHSVNDLPGMLAQVRRTLHPDGVFMAAMFGGVTLNELRQVLMAAEMECGQGVAPHVFPFVEIKDAGMLMQRAGFSMPVVDSYTLTVSYPNLLALLHDVRGMGEGNALITRPPYGLRREVFVRADAKYREMFPIEGDRIKASFEIITLTGMGG